MAENVAPHPTTNGDAPGLPFYEKSRQQLKELLNKKRQLERTLVGSPSSGIAPLLSAMKQQLLGHTC